MSDGMKDKDLIRVREVMKAQFDTVDGRMTITDALKTMKHVETKTLIVDKRHDDDQYGMVLLSDIAKLVLAKNRSPDRVNVYEVMAKPVMGIDPDMHIRYCARLFDQFGLSRAPVMENGRVIGIISYTDMVLKGLAEIES